MRKLSFEEIKSILFGAVEITGEKGILYADRFTKGQRSAWAKLDTVYGGVRCTAGVRLDFHTDASEVRFTLGSKDIDAADGSPDICKFEILLDGAFHSDPFVGEQTEIVLPLPEGKHRVTLIFPHYVRGYLHKAELSEGATLLPHRYDIKLLTLGDSITQGWHAESYVQTYVWRVALAMNADLVNLGVGGSCFHATTFEDMNFCPDLITVAYGCNDYSRGKSEHELRENMSAYLTPLQAAFPEVRTVGILPIPRLSESGDKPLKTFANCRRIIREEYEARGYEIVDGYDLLPPESTLYADHVHPNDAGFARYAENLLKQL